MTEKRGTNHKAKNWPKSNIEAQKKRKKNSKIIEKRAKKFRKNCRKMGKKLRNIKKNE